MTRLPVRLLIPVALVVLAWGGIHLLGSRSLAVTPQAWPSIASTATPSPAGLPLPAAVTPSPAAASTGTAIPVLPGALQQLNGSTRDTAIGLYALIQEMERALGAHLRQLTQQLEPGR